MPIIDAIRARTAQLAAERLVIQALTYRRAYEMAHPGHAFHGSDDDIHLIVANVGPIPDPSELTEVIIAEMEWVTIH